jgi:clan AA aspartic protease (TIGR02281 family)
MKVFLHFLVVLLLPLSAAADRVVFKNGRTMNGKILSETDTHVTILDGGLQLKVSKKRLARVERVDSKAPAASGPATHALGEAPPSIASSSPGASSAPPPEFVGFVGRVSELDTRRILASRAKVAAQGHVKHIHQLEREIEQADRQHGAMMDSLKGLQKNPVEYNGRVKQVNELRVATLNKQKQVTASKAKITQAQRTLNDYLNQSVQLIYRFQSMREAYQQAHGEGHRPYFDRMEARLNAHRQTFREVTVPHTRKGDALIVDVLLNGRIRGSFIVDTGASYVTIHRALAVRLNLPREGTMVKTQLADGSIIAMQKITLDSVEVGEARVANVDALVSEEKPATGIDGLLGMAFLKNFNLVFDPLSGKLVLTNLK